MPAAIELAKYGFKVLPLHTPNGDACDCRRPTCVIQGTDYGSVGKHPRLLNWQKQASDDLTFVAEWWQMWPAANIGAVAGLSGMVVLDVDPRNGGVESLKALTDEHGVLPYGPRSQTGSGGWHFFFKHPGIPLGNSASKVGPGLDVKADGGYVVVPPSVHATGVSYEWAVPPWDAEPPELPGWLLGLMRKAATRPEGGTQPVGDVIQQGERRDRLLSLGGTVRHRGASESEIFAYLMAVNAERCVPPMDRAEVAKLSAQVAQFEVGEAILVVGPKTRGEAEQREMPTPVSAADLQTRTFPPKKWIVRELLPVGLGILAGRIKQGKSFLALGVSIAVAEGSIALGYDSVDEGDVLMLAFEDTDESLQERLQMMMPAEDSWPARLHLVDMSMNWPRENEGGLEFLDSWLGQHPAARLVIIDTLQRFRARPDAKKGGNAYAEDYAAMEGMQKLAGKHGVCVLLIHHFNKTMHEDWVDQISGTTGIGGAADTLLGLDRKRGSTDATLKITGRRVKEADYAMQFRPEQGQWELIGDAADARMGRETAGVIEALTGIGEPATVQQVADWMTKTKPATKSLLYRASVNGFIKSYGGGVFGVITAPYQKAVSDEFHGGSATDATMPLALESALHRGISSISSTVSPVASTEQLASKTPGEAPKQPLSTPENVDGSVTSPVASDSGRNATGATGWPEKTLNQYPDWLVGKACPGCGRIDLWTLRVGESWACSACKPHLTVVRKLEGA